MPQPEVLFLTNLVYYNMKRFVLTLFVLPFFLFSHVNAQTISGKSIPYKAKKALEEVMEDCDVSSLTITSTARSVEDQVRIMFKNIERTSAAEQKRIYSRYGDAVIEKYEEGKKEGKSDSQIRSMMEDELEDQLPAAKRANKLNHVSGSNMIVFDIGMRSIKFSGNQSKDFVACLKSSRKFKRVLVEPKNSVIHVEMQK